MGNCTVTIKKKSPQRVAGRSALVSIALSSSYATGGDTIPRNTLGIGNNRLSHLMIAGHTTPSGHHVELIPGATEYADPKVRVRNVTTGAELGAASNNATESFLAEAIGLPYR